MGTPFGQILRTQREQKELSLQDVAHQTRIPLGILIALEEDDYDTLGSHAYSSGFLRLYCTFLAIDPAAAPEHWRSRPPADIVLLRWGLWGGPVGHTRQSRDKPPHSHRSLSVASPVAALTALFFFALVGAGVWGNHLSQEWAAMHRQTSGDSAQAVQPPGPFSTQPAVVGSPEQPVIVKAIPVEEPGFDQLFKDRSGKRRLVE